MKTKRDFVFTGLQPWDIPFGSNAKDIALELSKHNRVLYVSTPLVKWSREIKEEPHHLKYRIGVLKRREPPLRRINPNLWTLDCPFTLLPNNQLPDGPLFDVINYYNNRKMFRFVQQNCTELGFHDFVHFIDNDIYRSYYAKEFLNAAVSIYYLRDNLLDIDFWKKHALRLEPELIKKSDLAFCNSAYLASRARTHNPKSFDVGQGLDFSAYTASSYSIPEDIASLPRPIVGYMGSLTTLRLDVDLVYNVAQRNPSFTFALVGGADEGFKNHALNNLPNVHFLGLKAPETVPQYINSFDICINPQLLNAATIGNYPRKIDEYLALGKPTVATKTETMMMFKEHVHLCETPDDYHNAIHTILKEGTASGIEEKKAFAFTHTWEASVSTMCKIIDQHYAEFTDNKSKA